MAALDGRASGKMGMRAVVYYTTTTVIAVIIGIIMVLIIHPGKGSKDEFSKPQKIEQVRPADAFLDLIRYIHTFMHLEHTLKRLQYTDSVNKIRIYNPLCFAFFVPVYCPLTFRYRC